jgi:proline racemase
LNTQIIVSAVDYHTAGEPFRIISGGVPAIHGDTMLDKRLYARENLDHIRALVINEPRGHADMYGCFVTDPTTGTRTSAPCSSTMRVTAQPAVTTR